LQENVSSADSKQATL